MFCKLKIKYFFIFFISLFIVFNNRAVADVENINENYETNDIYDDYDDLYEDNYEGEEINGPNQNTTKNDDPFEKINRKIFSMNYFLMKNIFVPIGKGYKKITNRFVRDRISNFLTTLREPMIFFNSVLQLDFKNSVKSIATLGTNLTAGCFGLFNVAQNTSFYREGRTFGDTLAFYGVPNGPLIVLPFFGTYYLRDAGGFGVDSFVNPLYSNGLNIASDKPWIDSDLYLVWLGLYGLDSAKNLETAYTKFLKKSFDPYALTKEFYIQRRQNEINKLKGENL